MLMRKAALFYIMPCLLIFCACAGAQDEKELSVSTLKEVGMNKGKINTMTDALRNHKYSNIHSVLIAKNDKLVYEQYFPGKDQTWGEGDVGIVNFTKDSLHDANYN